MNYEHVQLKIISYLSL